MPFPNILSARNKVGSLLLAILYSAFYDYIYEHYVYQKFGYMGVEYIPMEGIKFFVYIAIASFPILAYRGLKSISAGFSIITYVMAYIPCIESLFVSNNIGSGTVFIYSVVLFVCMSSFFLTDSLHLWKKTFIKKTSGKCSIKAVEIVTLLLSVTLLLYNVHQLKMIDIFSESDLMYDLRAEYGENRSPWMGYVILWLSSAFFPFLLIYYLKTKLYIKYCLVIIGYFIVFMMDMQKVTFVMPFVLTIIFFTIHLNKNSLTKYFHSGLIFLIIAIAYVLYTYHQKNPVFSVLSALFIHRTMCITGHLFTLYIHFFADNPYTYYTHMNIINKITGAYPYNEVLGSAVTEGGMNANATFWITDGLAAMGWVGIVFISIIFILFKAVMNSIELKYDKIYCIVIFLPAISLMLNASLFTSIFSCGFLILYLLFRNIYIETLEIMH